MLAPCLEFITLRCGTGSSSLPERYLKPQPRETEHKFIWQQNLAEQTQDYLRSSFSPLALNIVPQNYVCVLLLESLPGRYVICSIHIILPVQILNYSEFQNTSGSKGLWACNSHLKSSILQFANLLAQGLPEESKCTPSLSNTIA